MDDMLSQEELNALLNGLGYDDQGTDEKEQLTDAEKDAIGEISNISMGTAATTLFNLVNKKVTITTPVVEYATWKDIVNCYDRPCVFIQIYYKDGLEGSNILILKEKDVKIIADLMMGGDGTNIDGKLTEMHLSAIGEAMNQMMGSAATSISTMLEKRVTISPPAATVVDMGETVSGENIADFLKGAFIKVSFHMVIENLVDSVLMQLYPFDFARNLYKEFVHAHSSEHMEADNQENKSESASKDNERGLKMPQQDNISVVNENASNEIQYVHQPDQNINVQPAQFAQFTPSAPQTAAPENIDLLMDVPLEVTVELGRTSKSIREILDFAPGTIIELNRLAGEPIDVLVNGKFVAKGEVVVMEEAFGVRVTEIVKQGQKILH